LLRGQIVVALRDVLLQLGGIGPSLATSSGKTLARTGVRVEVRGSAGRHMTQGAFTVGTAPECDIQVLGDPTVQSLQCLVVPLPGGIIVADAWSNGGTQVTWRWKGSIGGGSSNAGSGCCGVVIVEHGDRVVLSLGARTTIALGPNKHELGRKTIADDSKCAKMTSAHTTTTCGSLWSDFTSLSPRDDCSQERETKRIKHGSFASNGSSL